MIPRHSPERCAAVLLLAALLGSCAGTRVPAPRSAREVANRPGPERAPAKTGAAAEKPRERVRLPAPSGRAPELAVLLPETGGEEVLARYGDVEVTRAALFERLREREPGKAQELLELVLLDAKVHDFAKQQGIFVPDGELALAVAREEARVRRAYEKRSRGAADFGAFLEASYGLDEQGFRDRARLLAYRRLLRSYAVRFWFRQRGQLRVQLFVAADEARARDARAEVELGADLAELARESSRHPSSRQGGLLYELPLGLEHPALVLAAEVPEGALSPVGAFRRSGEPAAWAFVRVLERVAPDPRPYPEQAEELRRDLAQRGPSAQEIALFLAAP